MLHLLLLFASSDLSRFLLFCCSCNTATDCLESESLVIWFATSNLVNVVCLARRSDVSFHTRLALPRQWTNANAWICEFDGRKIEREEKSCYMSSHAAAMS
jgi:hypothetical protein